AGRIMSRTAAKGRFVKVGKKRIRQEGLVRHDEMMKWIADKGVVLRGGDLDEAPQAYRRLPDVLAAHAGTIRILHTLRPLGVAMGWARPELTWPWLRRAIFSLRDKSDRAPPLRCNPGPPPSGSHRAKAGRRKPRHGDRAIDQAANFL